MFKPEPGRRYDMPVVFGASQLRGQSRSGQLQVITHSFRTDPGAVEKLVPYHFRLAEPATITISGRMHLGVDWLAGRDYQSIRISVDCEADDAGSTLRAPYGLVVWESDPYPVIAGREYLGVSKLVADIPKHERDDTTAAFECFEYGTRLLRVEVSDIEPVAPEVIAARNEQEQTIMLGWKYIPGPQGTTDVDYTTKTVSRPHVLSMWTGESVASFGRPTWEQCPHAHHIVKALAELPVAEVLPATLTVSRSVLDRDATARLD